MTVLFMKTLKAAILLSCFFSTLSFLLEYCEQRRGDKGRSPLSKLFDDHHLLC